MYIYIYISALSDHTLRPNYNYIEYNTQKLFSYVLEHIEEYQSKIIRLYF